jgi:uncharacterized protein (TIGR03437 family)
MIHNQSLLPTAEMAAYRQGVKLSVHRGVAFGYYEHTRFTPLRCFAPELAMTAVLFYSNAFARNYYVATNGSDGNPGTLDQPFQTIQKAASVVVAGDTVYVRAGTYRETVTPARSGTQMAPITFQPYNGESVTISGADLIPESSWTSSRGNIWQAQVSWDLGEGNNQIFLDGKMMIEARWPNTTLDVSHPTVAHWVGGTHMEGTPDYTGTINDPALPSRPADYWKGTTIHFNPLNTIGYDPNYRGAGWHWQTGTVVGSAAGKLSFTWTPVLYRDWQWGPQPNVPGPENPYYLTGKLDELDSGGEWFLEDTSSRLYLWTPSGDSPAQHMVEAKRRQYAFDLRGRTFITIQGFKIFAAAINSNPQSAYLLLDGLNVQYVSHYSLSKGGATQAPYTGIQGSGSGILLVGSNNVLRNSTIAFSAGNGVLAMGDGPRVFNNVIHDVDYAGSQAAPIALSFYEPAVNRFLLAWNTLYDSGDGGIYHGLFSPKSGSGRVLHNNIYNYGLQTAGPGCSWVNQADGQGTEIAYNLCHDNPAGTGLMFDSAANNFIVHHNVIWNVLTSLNLNRGSTTSKVYNNTFAGTQRGLTPLIAPPQTLALPGTELKNNIFTARLQETNGAILQNNILPGTDPQFVDPTRGNFQLKATSPAIGAGVAIPPYTDGFTGAAPDIGAYDHRLPPWKAGGAQPIATIFSAASYNWALATDSVAVAFGSSLATGTAGASSTRLPTSLAGTMVTITDGANVDRIAPLFYASPTQLSFLIPPETVPGVALITITSSDGTVSLGSAPVFTAAPSLFSADGSGSGLAAAQIVRVKADGSQSYESVGRDPIDLGPDTDQVVLILYGTGIRGRSSEGAVRVTIGGVNSPVAYAGPQSAFAGLDQVNVTLPRSLAGRGSVDVVLTADGLTANTVTVTVR